MPDLDQVIGLIKARLQSTDLGSPIDIYSLTEDQRLSEKPKMNDFYYMRTLCASKRSK